MHGAGRIIMTGSKVGVLWHLHLNSIPSPAAQIACHGFFITFHSISFYCQSSKDGMDVLDISLHTLRDMSNRETVVGLPSLRKALSPVCTVCIHGKLHPHSFPINQERKRVAFPGLFFHCDIAGTFQVPSLGWHSYFMTFKDDHSSFRFVFLLRDCPFCFQKPIQIA